MKYIPIIIFVILFLACGNGKGGKNKDFPIAFEEFFDAKEWKFTSKEPLTYPPFTTNMKKRQ